MPGFVFQFNATTQTGSCACPSLVGSNAPYQCQTAPDFTKGFIPKNGYSISCRLMVKSTGLVSSANSSTCQCPDPYIWNTVVQECLCYKFNNFAYYSNGSACLNCSLIANATLQASCKLCQNPYGWGKFGCYYCLNDANSNGSVGSYCTCKPGYIWNYVTQSCQCDYNSDYVLINGGCVNCLSFPSILFNQCYVCYGQFFLQ